MCTEKISGGSSRVWLMSISKHICGGRTIDTDIDNEVMNYIVNNAEGKGGSTIIRIRIDFERKGINCP